MVSASPLNLCSTLSSWTSKIAIMNMASLYPSGWLCLDHLFLTTSSCLRQPLHKDHPWQSKCLSKSILLKHTLGYGKMNIEYNWRTNQFLKKRTVENTEVRAILHGFVINNINYRSSRFRVGRIHCLCNLGMFYLERWTKFTFKNCTQCLGKAMSLQDRWSYSVISYEPKRLCALW